MKDRKEGFISITAGIVIVVAVLIVGGGTYTYFINKNTVPLIPVVNNTAEIDTNTFQPETERGVTQGASFVPEAERIQVTVPKGGEKFEVGKIYEISWNNYSGNEALTIALQTTMPDGKVSSKIIASNISAVSSGSYKWTVTSEDPANRYKIEIYPVGGREYVGRSKDYFSISGQPLIIVDSQKANDRVDLSKPVVITGKARSVFGEGEFDVSASYMLDGKRQIIARALATCNLSGDGCEWYSGNLVDFKSTLDLSKSPVCAVNIEFFKRDERAPQTIPFYTLPLWLYGNANCQ